MNSQWTSEANAKNVVCLWASAVIALGMYGAASESQKPERQLGKSGHSAVLWQEPRDLEQKNLFDGPWGAGDAPDPTATYQFLREKRKGASPGFVVRDPHGRTWHVKQGREASPEVVVSRILSAVGYVQPPVYFLSTFKVASDQGVETKRFARFRLTKKGFDAQDSWRWDANPFLKTKPYQGLLVMLVLLNDADLKTSNNRIYAVKQSNGDVSWQYVVRDLGTSLGHTGRFAPKGNNVDRFESHPFITGKNNGYVVFAYPAVNHSLVEDSITPDDVRWACRWLGRLTDLQWRDAFRAGGYSPDLAARFIKRIREKIVDGENLL
jgi:hypothetical protein